MSAKLRPATTYAALVGRCLAALRAERDLAQAALAASLGLDASAWSRVEGGVTAATVEQLALACDRLGVRPAEVLARADAAATSLRRQGVHVEPRRALVTPSRGWALVASSVVGAVVAPGGRRRRRPRA
ncbi:MAG: helix-turn-helix domain-containing protein [Planctomycetes bacterium]|nr:helix-turn-helix domain-containing protein [Planctomycetota bacterium]